VVAGAVLNPAVEVGEHVIVNTCASVDHESVIEDGAHVGPGTRLGGRVRIQRGAWIGIGATIRDRVTIGAGARIGAGAVVLTDIPAGVVAYGVPAQVVRRVSDARS
jgi:acetyltransferase EpsM